MIDTTSLRRELGRAEAALPVDASAAISKAKTLMEVVANRVIIENGVEIETDRNFTALTNQAAQVLGVDRNSAVATTLAPTMVRPNSRWDWTYGTAVSPCGARSPAPDSCSTRSTIAGPRPRTSDSRPARS